MLLSIVPRPPVNPNCSLSEQHGELESFDPEEGFRSIGVTVSQPVRRREPAFGHVMY